LTQAQVIFSEPVTGVDAADLLVNGVAATSVAGSSQGRTCFSLPSREGVVNFTWAGGHNIRDLSRIESVSAAPAGRWRSTRAGSAALTNIAINEFLAANINISGLLDEDLQLLIGSKSTTAAARSSIWRAGPLMTAPTSPRMGFFGDQI